jgi:hypothetical protein
MQRSQATHVSNVSTLDSALPSPEDQLIDSAKAEYSKEISLDYFPSRNKLYRGLPQYAVLFVNALKK